MLAARTSLGVDKDLDQTIVGCAGKLVPSWAAPFRLGLAYCCSCALVCKVLSEHVQEEATWHFHGPPPLLKNPRIEKHRNHGQLSGLAHRSRALQSMVGSRCLENWQLQLVWGALGPLQLPTSRAQPAGGQLLLRTRWGASARQPLSSGAGTSS